MVSDTKKSQHYSKICIILQLKSRHGALDRVICREPEHSVLFVTERRIVDKLL
jgi:hypothetical protein